MTMASRLFAAVVAGGLSFTPALATTLQIAFEATNFRTDTYPSLPYATISGVAGLTYNADDKSYIVDELSFNSSLLFSPLDCELSFESWYLGGIMFILGGTKDGPSGITSNSTDFMLVFGIADGAVIPAFFPYLYYSMDGGVWGSSSMSLSVLSYSNPQPLSAPSPVPLPGALPLLASAIGLGWLLNRRRDKPSRDCTADGGDTMCMCPFCCKQPRE
jgi:hypothetical protein